MSARVRPRQGWFWGLGLVLCIGAGSGQAQTRWLTVGDAVLGTMRAGWDLGGGVAVSFGVTREVFLNGTLAVSTSFQIADVSRMAPGQAEELQRALSGMQLVQNGTQSVFSPGTATSPIGTTIQNSLNNQTIRTLTIIDTRTDGARMLRGLNSTGALQDALVNSRAVK